MINGHKHEQDDYDALQWEIAQLQVDNERLVADKERLDWLENAAKKCRSKWELVSSEAPAALPSWKFNVDGQSGETLRAAIDLAKEKGTP